MRKLLAFLLLGISISIFSVFVFKAVVFNQNCGGYLKRAADSNSVETAKAELQKAISYMKAQGLTDGYTSVFYKTPSEDVGFWYRNIKSSYDELNKVRDNTSAMEKSNLLMKLRETLLDSGEKGDNLTVPTGISKFPNNGLFAVLLTLGIFLFISSCIWLAYEFDRY